MPSTYIMYYIRY